MLRFNRKLFTEIKKPQVSVFLKIGAFVILVTVVLTQIISWNIMFKRKLLTSKSVYELETNFGIRVRDKFRGIMHSPP